MLIINLKSSPLWQGESGGGLIKLIVWRTQLLKHLTAGNREGVNQVVHCIGGAVAIVGAHEITSLARVIDTEANRGQIADDAIRQLDSLLERLFNEFRNLR